MVLTVLTVVGDLLGVYYPPKNIYYSEYSILTVFAVVGDLGGFNTFTVLASIGDICGFIR